MIISIILSLLTIFFISKNNIYLGNKLGIIDKPNKNKVQKASSFIRWFNYFYYFTNFFIFKF